MRRIFSFHQGTPILCLSFIIQLCFNLLMWFTLIPMAKSVYAAPPITPSGLNTQVNLSTDSPCGKRAVRYHRRNQSREQPLS